MHIFPSIKAPLNFPNLRQALSQTKVQINKVFEVSRMTFNAVKSQASLVLQSKVFKYAAVALLSGTLIFLTAKVTSIWILQFSHSSIWKLQIKVYEVALIAFGIGLISYKTFDNLIAKPALAKLGKQLIEKKDVCQALEDALQTKKKINSELDQEVIPALEVLCTDSQINVLAAKRSLEIIRGRVRIQQGAKEKPDAETQKLLDKNEKLFLLLSSYPEIPTDNKATAIEIHQAEKEYLEHHEKVKAVVKAFQQEIYERQKTLTANIKNSTT